MCGTGSSRTDQKNATWQSSSEHLGYFCGEHSSAKGHSSQKKVRRSISASWISKNEGLCSVMSCLLFFLLLFDKRRIKGEIPGFYRAPACSPFHVLDLSRKRSLVLGLLTPKITVRISASHYFLLSFEGSSPASNLHRFGVAGHPQGRKKRLLAFVQLHVPLCSECPTTGTAGKPWFISGSNRFPRITSEFFVKSVSEKFR